MRQWCLAGLRKLYKSNSEYLYPHPAVAYSLTCEATLGAAGFYIQNRADTVETAW
jgi:hypothetical protein